MTEVKITAERPGYPYKIGQVVSLRDDAARHLIVRGLATDQWGDEPEGPEEVEPKALSSFNMEELRAMADEREIPHGGVRKDDLIAAIEAHDESNPDD